MRPVLLKLWTFQLFSRAGATGASPRDSGPDSSVKPWFRHRRASRTETIDLIQPTLPRLRPRVAYSTPLTATSRNGLLPDCRRPRRALLADAQEGAGRGAVAATFSSAHFTASSPSRTVTASENSPVPEACSQSPISTVGSFSNSRSA